jgi:hypothetical protein
VARRRPAPPNGPTQTPLELLIQRSVEQALTTWLSLRAMAATDDVLREAFADDEFRQDFLTTARRVARETLERLEARQKDHG